MKKNRLLRAMILAYLLAGAPVYGQQPGAAPLYPAPPPLGPQAATSAAEQPYMPAVLSDWILGTKPCCDGIFGLRIPLYTEWYLTSGVSVPVARATSDLARELQTGWSIGGGARALFFNEALTRAWVVDLHLINTNQSAGHNNQGFPLTVYQNATKFSFTSKSVHGLATLQDSNRTMVGLGLGRYWYLWGTADSPGRHWRVGLDFGGRFGSHHVDLNQFGHVTDTCSGFYVGARSDLEWTCKNVVIFVGGRIEWAYTATDILQTSNSDLQDLNLLATFGFRY